MDKKMIIGILTYNRKTLLIDTLENLVEKNKSNLENIELLLVDNNSELKYQESNKGCANKYGAKYIFNEICDTGNVDVNIELGHKRLISEMLKCDADVYCMLEDDWRNTDAIPIDDLCKFLENNKDVGQVRLRDYRYDDSFYGGSSINFVTMNKIVFNYEMVCGSSVFKKAELHWVDSCNVMRKDVLKQMNCDFDVELSRMQFFHDLYPVNAQLNPGIFYHTGPDRIREDLRQKGLFKNEDIS